MKRALIIATVGGFLSQFEMNNVKLLQELGYEVHYAANFDSNIYQVDYEKFQENHVIIHPLSIVKNPLKLKQHYQVYRELKKLIEELEINLVHCHTPVGGMLGRTVAHFEKQDVYTIYTAHGFHFHKGSSWKNWIYYPVERLAGRWTDCLITINQEDYERANGFKLKKGGYAAKIPGVGLDTDRFKPVVKNETRNSGFRVVTIGELNRNKNLEVAIRAIKKVNQPEIVYDIYGRGRSVDYIQNIIKECELTEQVRYMGYCNKPEEILQGADLFLFPSIREGLGMAALEALACGVPVIALDNRGTREYMVDGKNGYLCRENSIDAFAENLQNAFLLYKRGEYRTVFPVDVVSSVDKFRLCETEKVMKDIYERADKSIRNHGCT